MLLFQPLIDELNASSTLISEQQPFSRLDGKKNAPTPTYISVDELDKLAPELRDSGFMVFRLGRTANSARSTEFAIVKTLEDWKDYFLIDDLIFGGKEANEFEVEKLDKTLEIFGLLPQLTESSMVNLGLGVGLIQRSLGIDRLLHSTVPATGRCNPTFSFRPHSKINNVLQHNSGQVEIDSLFLGERGGERCLFVLEAKNSKKLRTLAKHKLFYPMKALLGTVDYKIVPVYLRTVRAENWIDFYLAECQLGDDGDNQDQAALSELKVKDAWIARLANI